MTIEVLRTIDDRIILSEGLQAATEAQRATWDLVEERRRRRHQEFKNRFMAAVRLAELRRGADL